MLTKTEQDLHDFITTTYVGRTPKFNTSWTTCSSYETDEERLVGEFYLAAMGDKANDVSWIEAMPSLLISLAIHAGVEFNDDPRWFAYEQFMLDMMADLWGCEYRDRECEMYPD